MTDQRVTPVILCRGAGPRLRPVLQKKMPKHFVPLIVSLTT
jgi:mannose-1-phosphate guanylyltransferase